MILTSSLLIFGLLGCASAFFSHPTTWNGLHSTFGVNPFNSWNFDSLPRTTEEARHQRFELLDSQCTAPGQSFRGERYQYREDANVLLLFDKNGYIAGIQMRIPQTEMSETALKLNKDRAYTKDGDYWTSTVYFVDPDIICKQGRTKEQFESEGTGTGLYIQNGTSPSEVFHVPRNEEDIKKTLWGSGKCFPFMGKHYWFNIRPDMKPEEFFPYCLLYNNGRLDAFCFASNVYYADSQRFEHPTGTDADRCCIHAPKFFLSSEYKSKKQSTMHVYLTDSPRTSFC